MTVFPAHLKQFLGYQLPFRAPKVHLFIHSFVEYVNVDGRF